MSTASHCHHLTSPVCTYIVRLTTLQVLKQGKMNKTRTIDVQLACISFHQPFLTGTDTLSRDEPHQFRTGDHRFEALPAHTT